MPKSTKTNRQIPTKNYIIALAIILALLLGSLYLYKWYDVYNEDKIAESYLMKNKSIIYEIKDLSEIESVFSETPDEYFVYVSYAKSEEVYELEKNLQPIIEDYNLKEYIYYVNVTDIIEEEDYLEKINTALGLEEYKITQVPTILFFQDGKVNDSSIITREDGNMMQAGDFAKLLDIKGVVKNHKND